MLLMLTLVTVALVVFALAGYLTLVAISLVRASRSVRAIADGLEIVQRHTRPLEEKLVTINGAVTALRDGLAAADDHLGRAAQVFRL